MDQAVHNDGELWQVVARAQEGQREALAELFDRFYDGVYRYSYVRLGSVTDAEEAAQETFTQMVRSIKRFKRRGGTTFEAWLFRVARNVCADEQRRRYRRKEDVTSEVPTQFDLAPSAEDDVVRRAEIEHLRSLLAALPEQQQQVLELRFAADLSAEDIGKVLGKSAGAVRIQQMRALQSLREIMEPSA